jgi:hypothetical protein
MPSRRSSVCGRRYIDETSMHLEVYITEHKYNRTQGLLEKSKLAQHSCEEGHKICWNEAKILQVDSNTTYSKYKEPTDIALLDHSVSQPSLDISPIWISPPPPRCHSRSKKTTIPSSVD